MEGAPPAGSLPMSLFDWFADRRKTAPTVRTPQEPEEGDGLWSKCPECGLVVYRKDLVANASVCKGCGYHHRINSAERIQQIADPEGFEPLDEDLSPTDPLAFKDRRTYADRIRDSQSSTGLRDAVITGICAAAVASRLPWESWISASWAARWARWWARSSPG
jgi:acetyl-CoA carboxylase carboxyl transferase subunit beta